MISSSENFILRKTEIGYRWRVTYFPELFKFISYIYNEVGTSKYLSRATIYISVDISDNVNDYIKLIHMNVMNQISPIIKKIREKMKMELLLRRNVVYIKLTFCQEQTIVSKLLSRLKKSLRLTGRLFKKIFNILVYENQNIHTGYPFNNWTFLL
jgi:hypothetical protein